MSSKGFNKKAIIEQILSDKTKPALPLPVEYLEEYDKIWGKKWGAQSEIGKLEEVLVCKPGDEMAPPENELKWYGLRRQIDVKKAIKQHEELVRVLTSEGVKVHFLKTPPQRRGPYGQLSRIWATRDPGIVVNGGAIISRMSLPFRKGDEYYWAKTVMELGCPILYTVNKGGTFEGGNVIWLDPEHVCIGKGIRTNQEGIDQVSEILKLAGVQEIIVVPIPGWLRNLDWPAGGFAHLDTVFGYVDNGLALIYPPGVPFDFIEFLMQKGINLIEVNPDEAKDYACNTLALEPGKIIMVGGLRKTRKELEKEGVDVIEVDLSEFVISGGGPHCATGPLIRQPGPKLS
jgi:N-dimethylarginine dimethylaminohydrolase